MRNTIETIPHLIYKYIVRTISKAEHKQLDDWINEDTMNRQLFMRMTDIELVEREFQKRQYINTERALADMKKRIGTEKRHKPAPAKILRSAVRWGAAATLLCLIGIAVVTGYRHSIIDDSAESLTMTTIQHGKTRAVLTLSNGINVELGADSAKNIAAIDKASELYATRYNESLPSDSANTAGTLNLSIPRGGEFHVTLEDGTEVWLNAESRLIYPEVFNGNERRVELYGEAYFKVAPNKEKPFVVTSAGQEVHVTGTEFNIHNYKEDTSVYTTLVNGSITLKPQSYGSGELVLTPGHQAVFSKTNYHADVRTVDTNTVTCWKDGRFVFEDQTLEQIMCTLSRWYDFTYEFKNKELKNTLFMGSIPRYGEFSEVAHILEASGGLYFKVDGKNVRIYKK